LVRFSVGEYVNFSHSQNWGGGAGSKKCFLWTARSELELSGTISRAIIATNKWVPKSVQNAVGSSWFLAFFENSKFWRAFTILNVWTHFFVAIFALEIDVPQNLNSMKQTLQILKKNYGFHHPHKNMAPPPLLGVVNTKMLKNPII